MRVEGLKTRPPLPTSMSCVVPVPVLGGEEEEEEAVAVGLSPYWAEIWEVKRGRSRRRECWVSILGGKVLFLGWGKVALCFDVEIVACVVVCGEEQRRQEAEQRWKRVLCFSGMWFE